MSYPKRQTSLKIKYTKVEYDNNILKIRKNATPQKKCTYYLHRARHGSEYGRYMVKTTPHVIPIPSDIPPRDDIY
jgi:hypothetical protein